MTDAAAWHIGRGEWVQIFGHLVVAGLMAYVAVAEWLGTTRGRTESSPADVIRRRGGASRSGRR
jgi:hypothetical protein